MTKGNANDPLRLRFACDTGGTFTDLVVDGMGDALRLYKRPTTPRDPVAGLLDVVGAAADDLGLETSQLLGQGDLFIFGTTRATNAIVTGNTARTALLVTEGHPDILVLREGGGRTSLFDYSQEYPDPYVPRSLTFEVPERIGASGEVVRPVDEKAVVELADELARREVEAVAVSLLWSIVNPVHEKRVGELLAERLPGVPVTLGHELNPTIREYRRTSSAAIDASLKPLMSTFFSHLAERLREAGFAGRLLIMTSSGGVLDAAEVAATPIHSIGSGPAAAPVAGRFFAKRDAGSDTAIVTDAGGTTFDVSVIRAAAIPWTRDTIIGHPVHGFMTGFPSVDARSIGAGGGSIAWVDEGGMLHVGPQSAGAEPGPACYGRGGTRPTVSDACVALGYIDPEYFLGGAMRLDVRLAEEALSRDVAGPLEVTGKEAACAVLNLATERMVQAIEEITLIQGIDPRSAVTVAGGGGAGLYAVGIARRLRTPSVVIPEFSAGLSATGALLSDLQRVFVTTEVTTTSAFDYDRANAALVRLGNSCRAFVKGPGADGVDARISYSVEARYPHQVWELDVPLEIDRFTGPDDVERLRESFHAVHEQVFAVSDPESPVEVVAWRAHVRCALRSIEMPPGVAPSDSGSSERSRLAYFSGLGDVDTRVIQLELLEPGRLLAGPVLVESAVTTVVIDPDAAVERLGSGSLLVWPVAAAARKGNAGAMVDHV